MPLPWSKNQANRLGARLASDDRPASEDLQALQEFRAAYDEPLAAVAARLTQLGLEPGTRIKTVQTIIEKLRRQELPLATIQDIAGARVVVSGSRREQDRQVRRVKTAFQVRRVTDRRKDHSWGYRAVHVIVIEQGLPVEIQVRTELQDMWAQLFESVADRWGRQIRYGEPPEHPETVLPGGTTRQDFVQALAELADLVDAVERGVAELEVQEEITPADAGEEERLLLAEFRELLGDAETAARRALRNALTAWEGIQEVDTR